MKTIRLLLLSSLLLISIPFSAFSQQLEKHKMYIFQTENGPNTYSSIDEVKSISEVGDSILMEIEHENEKGNRVKDSLWSYESRIYIHDVILYDYNLNVGDTFRIPDFALSDTIITYIVKSIDTIIGINGSKIKRWYLKHDYDWLTWHLNYGEANQGWFYTPLYNALIGTSTVIAVCQQDSLVFWRDSILPLSAMPSCDFDYLDSYLEIEESDVTKGIEIYPNPANRQLFINGFITGQKLIYNIYQTDGKLAQSGSTVGVIDIGLLPKGLYIIKASNGTQNLLSRFVKE